MAFVSATSLRVRAPVQAASPRVCRISMEDTSVEKKPIEPLNADSAHPMKEPYSVAVGKKAPVCRCWQSNKFPLCDGSHNAFNKETGSNIGPLVVSATAEE